MSFSDLVTGGAACGPSNPLQSLGKRFAQDRSTQMDRFDGEGGESSIRPSFRAQQGPHGPTNDPAFFHQHGPSAHAFDLQPLNGALPLAQSSRSGHGSPAPADMHGAWQQHQHAGQPPPSQMQHFERSFRHGTPVTATADSRWAREYSPSALNVSPAMSQGQQHQPGGQQHVAHLPMAYGPAPVPFQNYPQNYSRMNMMHMPPGSAEAQHMLQPAHALDQGSKAATQDIRQWDTAFTAIEEGQKSTSSPIEVVQHAAGLQKQQQTSVDSTDADELARTAGRLVSTVEHETNDKFKQSNFLNLMRKIRDRQAGIQGTDIVETPGGEQQQASSASLDKGKGRAMDLTGAAQPPSNQMEATGQFQNQTPRTLPARDAINATRVLGHGPGPTSLADELAGRQELNDLWAEEDERSEAIEREHMRRAAFVGDAGNIDQRRMEDEAEFNKYQGLLGAQLGPAAAGLKQSSTSAMEEDFDELDGADFVGRRWEGTRGRGVPGAQSAEWDILQKDWDAWQAGSAGLEQMKEPPLSATSAPAYRFHAYNPYVGTSTSSAWQASTAALPPDMQTVLEREAAVQRDPNNASAWYDLGVKQQENERESLAIAALHRAIQLDPTLRDAWLALAVSYTNETDRSAALESVERWVDATPEYRAVVRQYRQTQDGSDAVSKAAQTPIERHEQVIKLLIALARHGSTEDRIDADIQVALGVLFNASEDYDKAVDCFTTALQVRPEDWLMYNRLGATLSNSGRSAEALRYYQQALELKPGFVRCHFNMSISCLNLQMYREAASHIYTALTLQSESVDLSRDAQLQEDGSQSGGGVTSSSLWETLRVACELMDRPDLANLAVQRDLDRFDPSEFWAGADDNGAAMEPNM